MATFIWDLFPQVWMKRPIKFDQICQVLELFNK